MSEFSDAVKVIEPSKNPQNWIDLQEWVWPKYDEECWQIIRANWEGYHERLWTKYVDKKEVCIQAGGCGGLYPRLLGNLFGIVYTFEPDPINFFCLAYNCQRQNIIKMQAALGEFVGSVMVATHPKNCGMHTLIKCDDAARVPQIPIDMLDLKACDLIALDIEGTELEVIRGAATTINRHRPVIIVEDGGRQEIADHMLKIDYTWVDRSAYDDIFVPNERVKFNDKPQT